VRHAIAWPASELDDRDNRIAILTAGRRRPVSRAGYTRLSGLLDN
jgi:hypothetical protein